MKYSVMLSVATISMFVASTYATEPRTMTLQERMERSRQPLTVQQTEQGRIRSTSADVTEQDIEQFNAEQQQPEEAKKKKWYHFGRK